MAAPRFGLKTGLICLNKWPKIATVKDIKSNLFFPLSQHIRKFSFHTVDRCHAFEARDVKVTPPKGPLNLDTHAAVKHLEYSGFTTQQAEGLVRLIVEIVSSSADSTRHNLVTKEQQEIVVQQLMANLESVKKDMIILEKSEFQALRNETDRLFSEIRHLRAAVDDDLSKLSSGMRLDINLEKARSIEEHHDMKGKYEQLDHRIDTEIANLRTMFEKYRNDIFKYAGGTLVSCVTITLGFYRLWS
ncbi:mitochondrial calcium uniporter regulator 1-like [Tubulanus polymorphus]|uniref:mitochondrial calcium uniporter regulator 1-like n=1 Tax=Tubulanus polymorphus TaxID=672921 RepID=UPI003DA69BBD